MNIKEEIKNKETRHELITGVILLGLPFIIWYAIEIQEWWPLIATGVISVTYEIYYIISSFFNKRNKKFKLNEK